MKKKFKKKEAYNKKDVCYDNSALDEKSCLKSVGLEDNVSLKEVMADESFTPIDRLWWLYHKSLTIHEKEQLGEYLQQRYFAIYNKRVTRPQAISLFISLKKSPISNKGEFNSLLNHLDLL